MPGRGNRKCESPEQGRAGLNRIVGGRWLEWSGQGLCSGVRADQVCRSHSPQPLRGLGFSLECVGKLLEFDVGEWQDWISALMCPLWSLY